MRAYKGEAVVVRFGGIYGPGRNRLIKLVRSGTRCQDEPPNYTNRIHRDDCAGVLMYLLYLDSPESIYLAVDSYPAPQCEIMQWLSQQLGVSAPSKDRIPGVGASKRCSNRLLLKSGYELLYPSYREGYAAVLSEQI